MIDSALGELKAGRGEESGRDPSRRGDDVNATGFPDGYLLDVKKHPIRSKEAAMKKRSIITWVAAGLLLAGSPLLRSSDTDAGSMIKHAESVILDLSASHEVVKAAWFELLDASLLILPRADYADDYRSSIETAKKEFGPGALFSDKGYQALAQAYRLVAAGEEWEFPEELLKGRGEEDHMEKVKAACMGKLDSALSELKAGRKEESVRSLLAFILMVITPVCR